MLSKTCKYGIQALILLASINQSTKCDVNKCVLGKQLSSALSIPKEYLHKVMQKLSREKLVCSMKGPQGGFCLAREPKDITLFDIVKAIDGVEAFNMCIIRAQQCDEENPCALHHYWRKNLTQARTILDQVTLDILVADLQRGRRVLEFSEPVIGLEEFKKRIGLN